MFCPKCGQLNGDNNYKCTQCDEVLRGEGEVQYVAQSNAGGAIIPTKNPAALIAYYCAIFSVIPCLGLPLGLCAWILGIVGLINYNKDPMIKGKVHAWVGIILGLITFLLNLVFVILPVIAILAEAQNAQ